MWTLVSPLIDETSREKFLFYAGNDYQDPGGLIDYIDHKYIPDWLGGSSRTAIPEGGLVPKSYYMSAEEFVKDQSPGPAFLEESFYHSTSLSRGQVHEGLIHITDKGTVITWDFDVMRHDVVFTVYRLTDPLPQTSDPKSPLAVGEDVKSPPQANHHHTTIFTFPSSTHHSKATSASASDSHVSCIEKGWKEGVDYFKVESSIVCHDGESIQGSHVTANAGTYVLQWKFFDRAAGAGLVGASGSGAGGAGGGHHHMGALDDVIDTITHNKAKVMYYYETLNSSDYKGSMTSLQSCQSGFSTISKASKHSTSGVSSGVSSSHSEKK